MRRRVPVVVVLLSAALSACGSTVQSVGSAGAVPQGAAPGLGAPPTGSAAPLPGGAPAADAGGAAGLTGPVAGGPGGAGAAGGSLQGSSGGSGPAGSTPARPVAPGPGDAAPSGPGISATSVQLGIPYCNDCASGNAAIGAGGQDPGDTRRYYQAALNDVNARGGVFGRKLVPLFHEVSVSDNIEASQQAACERWTKDNEVAAMFFRGELIYGCAKKAGVIVAPPLGSGGTQPLYDRYPNLFAPATIRLEALYATTVNAMVKAGWQRPSAKWPTGRIGLITWQSNEYEYAMKNGYLKAMAAAGLQAKDVRYIAVPQNANALADASAAISNAVLSFRDQGIDHVFIGDGPAGIFGGTGLTFLFLQNAQSQQYFPRYGFNSNNSPDFPNHPQAQLVGMIGIDGIDSEPANDAGIAPNPVRERCLRIMVKAGLPVGDSQTRTLAVNACEIAFFAEAVLGRARGSTLDRVIPAAESLGTSYRSPLTYGTRIGPGRHDGLYLFRNLQFDEGCRCIKYTSGPYAP